MIRFVSYHRPWPEWMYYALPDLEQEQGAHFTPDIVDAITFDVCSEATAIIEVNKDKWYPNDLEVFAISEKEYFKARLAGQL